MACHKNPPSGFLGHKENPLDFLVQEIQKISLHKKCEAFLHVLAMPRHCSLAYQGLFSLPTIIKGREKRVPLGTEPAIAKFSSKPTF